MAMILVEFQLAPMNELLAALVALHHHLRLSTLGPPNVFPTLGAVHRTRVMDTSDLTGETSGVGGNCFAADLASNSGSDGRG
jgi:hypothetical protein